MDPEITINNGKEEPVYVDLCDGSQANTSPAAAKAVQYKNKKTIHVKYKIKMIVGFSTALGACKKEHGAVTPYLITQNIH